MRADYAEWIEFNVRGDGGGFCYEYTHRMASAFPELRTASGYYCAPNEGEIPHWWCVAPDGSVVDPTAGQFQHQGGSYVEKQPGEGCLRCGNVGFGGVLIFGICNKCWLSGVHRSVFEGVGVYQ